MKDKALEKLSKNELLELMLYLRKEYDKLNAENEKLLQKLEDKKSITDRLDRLERQVAALTGHFPFERSQAGCGAAGSGGRSWRQIARTRC